MQTLQFVEANSIKPDSSIRQVRFTLKDDQKDKFDLAAIQDALKKKGYNDVSVLVGPTTQ